MTAHRRVIYCVNLHTQRPCGCVCVYLCVCLPLFSDKKDKCDPALTDLIHIS